MLRTNLASRPFYNERAVRAAVLLIGLLALAFTLFNVAEILSLRARSRDLDGQVADADARANTLRAEAQKIRQSLDQQDVSAVQQAARQANQLIDRRAFSWTALFNHLETTLPPNVRITAVQPQIDQEGRMVIALGLISRRVEDLDAFVDALEQSGAFTETLVRSDALEEDGMLRSLIQGFYRGTASTQPPASESGGSPPPPAASTSDAGGGR